MDLVRKRTPTISPHDSLKLIQLLFPERVTVLQEAFQAADTDGSRFRKPGEVFDLLARLCTTYHDALVEGGDAKAKKVFTAWEYASQGSDEEVGSVACERDRTRFYNGRKLVMWKHLRAGGKGAAEDCLRIHFEWVASERRIVVGHCGAHLKEA